MRRIPVAGPWITEVDYVSDAVRDAWYAGADRWHERFEQAFASYLGVRDAVALPSCTSGIHLALLALGIGPGDEVIVPDRDRERCADFYVGATTVVADIDPDTCCLSADSVEACMTPRTEAVIPVDLYGGMPDSDFIRTSAARRAPLPNCLPPRGLPSPPAGQYTPGWPMVALLPLVVSQLQDSSDDRRASLIHVNRRRT